MLAQVNNFERPIQALHKEPPCSLPITSKSARTSSRCACFRCACFQQELLADHRADLDKQLEKAVSVLASRYDTDLPRSLVLEFTLQRTLVQLHEQGDESPLVEWLDSVLPQR